MLRNQLDHRKWKIRYRTLSVYHVAWEIALGLWSKGRTWPEFILDLVMLLVHSVGCYMAVSLYLTVCWTEGRRGTSREAGRTCKEPRNCRYSLFSATRQLALLSNGWHSSNNTTQLAIKSFSGGAYTGLYHDGHVQCHRSQPWDVSGMKQDSLTTATWPIALSWQCLCGKTITLASAVSIFKCWFCHLPVLWPWTS